MIFRAVILFVDTSSSFWASGMLIMSSVDALLSRRIHLGWSKSLEGCGSCVSLSIGLRAMWSWYHCLASFSSLSHQSCEVAVRSAMIGSINANQSFRSIGPVEGFQSVSLGTSGWLLTYSASPPSPSFPPSLESIFFCISVIVCIIIAISCNVPGVSSCLEEPAASVFRGLVASLAVGGLSASGFGGLSASSSSS